MHLDIVNAPWLMTWSLNCRTSHMQGQLHQLPTSTILTRCKLDSERCAVEVKR